MECVMVSVFFGCPAKHKAAVLPEPLQFRHVLAAELPGQNMDGEEKTVPFPFPVVLRIKPSAQHDGMDMGVEVHFRPPGMEDAEVTNLCPQVFWVCTKLVKGAGSSISMPFQISRIKTVENILHSRLIHWLPPCQKGCGEWRLPEAPLS